MGDRPKGSPFEDAPDEAARWTVQASRFIHRDRWIAVRADDCVTPRGVVVAPYYVLDYPDFVHAVVLDEAGGVVLVRQYRHGIGRVTLELPGGIMDAGDPDPLTTAIREVREETGYEGARAQLISTFAVDPAKMTNRMHGVLIEGAVARGPGAQEPTEDIALVVLPAEEALTLALAGGLPHAAQVSLLIMGLRAAGRLSLQYTAADPPPPQ